MSTASDFLGSSDFDMTSLTSLTRRRAKKKIDPYNPDRVVDDWSDPELLSFGGFVSSQISTEQTDAVRSQLITTVQIVVPNPAVDIAKGDRITDGTHVWSVTGIPTHDMNPFTSWQPTLVVDVEEVNG